MSKERSSESVEAIGRTKLMVVMPSRTLAEAFEMSWLASIGGSDRDVAYLHV